ncbi:MAG: hypothetical protein K2G51_15045, partial [Lachnospiraceae bacterium]|nr:hypothetical protein [Lachnospiraceae bacterium]
MLLGSLGTKRTIYLEKAAEQEGLPIVFADWNSWNDCRQLPAAEELFVKIDPPLWSSCFLEELLWLTVGSRGQLAELSICAQSRRITFVKTPSAC